MARKGQFSGAANHQYRHGQTRRSGRTTEYRIWASMIQRCTNPRVRSYRSYGQRGISVCERWLSFAAFYADVGPRPSTKHTLDRIDNDGHYEPGNVRWATALEQSRNSRHARRYEFNGEVRCISEWAEVTGINYWTLRHRFDAGWSPERALSTAVGQARGSLQ